MSFRKAARQAECCPATKAEADDDSSAGKVKAHHSSAACTRFSASSAIIGRENKKLIPDGDQVDAMRSLLCHRDFNVAPQADAATL
jgi:hypothetical protein